MPAATVGFNAKLLINDGASQTYVKVDKAVQITLPERAVDLVEVTALDETDAVKRYVASPLVDGGTLKVQVYFTGANLDRFTALLGKQWQTATVETAFQVQPPDPDGAGADVAKQVAFKGIVNKVGEATFSKSADAVMFDVEVKVNSKWAITDLANATG